MVHFGYSEAVADYDDLAMTVKGTNSGQQPPTHATYITIDGPKQRLINKSDDYKRWS